MLKVYKGGSGREESEPVPQISWLKSMNLRELGRKVKKGEMKKSTPPLTLPGWAWILSETPVLLIPRPHSLPQFTQRRRTRSRAETI